MDSIPPARLERAQHSLEGLSVGDAFGKRFFVHSNVAHLLIGDRALPAPIWKYTDDTQMALSIMAVLRRHGTLDQSRLAKSFGTHYDISRGCGPAMHRLLPAIRSRIHWSKAARELFGGQGSFGNASAM
jgi:ADP-ribosylglycohydrolase